MGRRFELVLVQAERQFLSPLVERDHLMITEQMRTVDS